MLIVAVEVAVVIPARNEASVVASCVRALAAQTVGASTLEVIVVAAGEDSTAATASAAAVGAGFRRFEVVRLAEGNKNAALQVGCARATAPLVVLLDADTILAPDAVAALARAVQESPECAIHGAATPRFDTWVSRYWELNRKVVKDLRYDGTLSGELIAVRRATLSRVGLGVLFPAEIGAKDDLYLGRALTAHGCRLAYLPTARATTLVPWTIGGLAATMLRSRRGLIALLPLGDACVQAAASALVVGALPAAITIFRSSHADALALLTPLLAHVGVVIARVEALRRHGLGQHRRELPAFILLDLLGRALKLLAFVERIAGREPPRSFRGERPDHSSAFAALEGHPGHPSSQTTAREHGPR